MAHDKNLGDSVQRTQGSNHQKWQQAVKNFDCVAKNIATCHQALCVMKHTRVDQTPMRKMRETFAGGLRHGCIVIVKVLFII